MTSPPSSVRRTVTIKAAFDQHVENGHSPAEALKRTDDWLRSGNDQNAKPPLPADYRLELQDDDIALLAGDAVLDREVRQISIEDESAQRLTGRFS
jgi:hypothetical protein